MNEHGGMVRSLRLRSEEETRALGVAVGQSIPAGSVVALVGELGAGKTTLSRALCEGLGVRDLDEVASPTFTLLNEYEGRVPVSHFDFYRLANINSLPEIGLGDALASGATVLVEWADKFPESLPDERTLWIRLRPVQAAPEEREVEIELPPGVVAHGGEVWSEVLQAIDSALSRVKESS